MGGIPLESVLRAGSRRRSFAQAKIYFRLFAR